MKLPRSSCALLGLVLVSASPCLRAQDSAPAEHARHAAHLSASASGQAVNASGHLAAGSTQAVSAVAAVPVRAGASALATTGASVAGVGASSAAAGAALGRGAQALWDFASGDPACRPALDRARSVPPAKAAPPVARRDPPPSEALRLVR